MLVVEVWNPWLLGLKSGIHSGSIKKKGFVNLCLMDGNLCSLTNVVGIISEEDNQMNWNTSPQPWPFQGRLANQSTYATWLYSSNRWWQEEWLHGGGLIGILPLLIRAVKWPRRSSESIRVSSGHLDRGGHSSRSSLSLSQFLNAQLDECVSNMVCSIGRYKMWSHRSTHAFSRCSC